MSENSELISTSELGQRCGVSRQAIYLWRLSGCPYYRIAPKKIIYDYESVKAWIKRRSDRKKPGYVK